MPSESFYIVSLLPPFPELPGNACARSIPKSGYFRSEKKSEKKRVFVTRCTRVRFWPACKRSGSERTSVGRGEEGCRGGRERELGVKQRWSRRENENHTHLRTRSEREGKIGGGERHVVSPRKWKFDDGSTRGKKEEGESEAHPYYMRVPHGRRAKSTSNPLTEINRKKARVIYRVTPPI